MKCLSAEDESERSGNVQRVQEQGVLEAEGRHHHGSFANR